MVSAHALALHGHSARLRPPLMPPRLGVYGSGSATARLPRTRPRRHLVFVRVGSNVPEDPLPEFKPNPFTKIVHQLAAVTALALATFAATVLHDKFTSPLIPPLIPNVETLLPRPTDDAARSGQLDSATAVAAEETAADSQVGPEAVAAVTPPPAATAKRSVAGSVVCAVVRPVWGTATLPLRVLDLMLFTDTELISPLPFIAAAAEHATTSTPRVPAAVVVLPGTGSTAAAQDAASRNSTAKSITAAAAEQFIHSTARTAQAALLHLQHSLLSGVMVAVQQLQQVVACHDNSSTDTSRGIFGGSRVAADVGADVWTPPGSPTAAAAMSALTTTAAASDPLSSGSVGLMGVLAAPAAATSAAVLLVAVMAAAAAASSKPSGKGHAPDLTHDMPIPCYTWPGHMHNLPDIAHDDRPRTATDRSGSSSSDVSTAQRSTAAAAVKAPKPSAPTGHDKFLSQLPIACYNLPDHVPNRLTLQYGHYTRPRTDDSSSSSSPGVSKVTTPSARDAVDYDKLLSQLPITCYNAPDHVPNPLTLQFGHYTRPRSNEVRSSSSNSASQAATMQAAAGPCTSSTRGISTTPGSSSAGTHEEQWSFAKIAALRLYPLSKPQPAASSGGGGCSNAGPANHSLTNVEGEDSCCLSGHAAGCVLGTEMPGPSGGGESDGSSNSAVAAPGAVQTGDNDTTGNAVGNSSIRSVEGVVQAAPTTVTADSADTMLTAEAAAATTTRQSGASSTSSSNAVEAAGAREKWEMAAAAEKGEVWRLVALKHRTPIVLEAAGTSADQGPAASMLADMPHRSTAAAATVATTASDDAAEAEQQTLLTDDCQGEEEVWRLVAAPNANSNTASNNSSEDESLQTVLSAAASSAVLQMNLKVGHPIVFAMESSSSSQAKAPEATAAAVADEAGLDAGYAAEYAASYPSAFLTAFDSIDLESAGEFAHTAAVTANNSSSASSSSSSNTVVEAVRQLLGLPASDVCLSGSSPAASQLVLLLCQAVLLRGDESEAKLVAAVTHLASSEHAALLPNMLAGAMQGVFRPTDWQSPSGSALLTLRVVSTALPPASYAALQQQLLTRGLLHEVEIPCSFVSKPQDSCSRGSSTTGTSPSADDTVAVVAAAPAAVSPAEYTAAALIAEDTKAATASSRATANADDADAHLAVHDAATAAAAQPVAAASWDEAGTLVEGVCAAVAGTMVDAALSAVISAPAGAAEAASAGAEGSAYQSKAAAAEACCAADAAASEPKRMDSLSITDLFEDAQNAAEYAEDHASQTAYTSVLMPFIAAEATAAAEKDVAADTASAAAAKSAVTASMGQQLEAAAWMVQADVHGVSAAEAGTTSAVALDGDEASGTALASTAKGMAADNMPEAQTDMPPADATAEAAMSVEVTCHEAERLAVATAGAPLPAVAAGETVDDLGLGKLQRKMSQLLQQLSEYKHSGGFATAGSIVPSCCALDTAGPAPSERNRDSSSSTASANQPVAKRGMQRVDELESMAASITELKEPPSGAVDKGQLEHSDAISHASSQPPTARVYARPGRLSFLHTPPFVNSQLQHNYGEESHQQKIEQPRDEAENSAAHESDEVASLYVGSWRRQQQQDMFAAYHVPDMSEALAGGQSWAGLWLYGEMGYCSSSSNGACSDTQEEQAKQQDWAWSQAEGTVCQQRAVQAKYKQDQQKQLRNKKKKDRVKKRMKLKAQQAAAAQQRQSLRLGSNGGQGAELPEDQWQQLLQHEKDWMDFASLSDRL